MKPQIPWLRVFVEGVVIVGSILLAFGLQAWWEGRQEREEEQQYVVALLDEMRAAEAELERDRQARIGRMAALDSLQGHFVGRLADGAAFTSWVREVIRLAFFFPPTAVYDDLVSSGGVRLIRSDELRLALMNYQQERPRLRYMEEREQIIVEQELRPYLNQSFAMDTEVASPVLRARISADQQFRNLVYQRRFRLETTIRYEIRVGETIARLISLLEEKATP